MKAGSVMCSLRVRVKQLSLEMTLIYTKALSVMCFLRVRIQRKSHTITRVMELALEMPPTTQP